MIEFHGWKIARPASFSLFTSEDNATLLVKCDGVVVSEIEFIESTLKVRYSARLIIINSNDKIISFK